MNEKRKIMEQNPTVYVGHINGFSRVCAGRKVGLTAQLLMLKIFGLFARAGWREWISIDNHELMREIGCASETTIISARNRLSELGFIDYQRGFKHVPARYRLAGKPELPEYLKN